MHVELKVIFTMVCADVSSCGDSCTSDMQCWKSSQFAPTNGELAVIVHGPVTAVLPFWAAAQVAATAHSARQCFTDALCVRWWVRVVMVSWWWRSVRATSRGSCSLWRVCMFVLHGAQVDSACM